MLETLKHEAQANPFLYSNIEETEELAGMKPEEVCSLFHAAKHFTPAFIKNRKQQFDVSTWINCSLSKERSDADLFKLMQGFDASPE